MRLFQWFTVGGGAVDPGGDGLGLRTGCVRTSEGLLELFGEPLDVCVRRLDLAALGFLGGEEPDHPLPPVGDGPHLGEVFAFEFAGGLFAVLDLTADGLEALGRHLHGLLEAGEFLVGALCAAGEVIGVGAGVSDVGDLVRGPIGGDAHRRGDTFGQRRQGEP